MGCWDVFCFICGNPCHSLSIEYIEEQIELDKKSKQPFIKTMIKRIEAMTTFNKEVKALNRNTRWMDRCSMLLANDQVVHNVSEIACNVVFSDKKISVEHISSSDNNLSNYPYGIFIHTACLKFIKKQYNVALKFSSLPPVKPNGNKLFAIPYGGIEKYWDQQFNFIDIILDKKTYLCSDPLKNDLNVSQIKKNISKLKLKNDPNRKGPSVSATFYSAGMIKLGNNKKFWIIRGNKWMEMPDQLIKLKLDIDLSKLSNSKRKYVERLSFIGQHNTIPVFITISSYKKYGYRYSLEVLLAESYKDVFMKTIQSNH